MDLIHTHKFKLILGFSRAIQNLVAIGAIKEQEDTRRVNHVKAIVVTGEGSPAEFITRLQRIFPEAIISDQYGIAEATVLTSNIFNRDRYRLKEYEGLPY